MISGGIFLQKELIMVIDDESHILELISYNLEKEGYRVIACETGEEGLKLIEKYQPDLIILDLMLPGIDGLEVCKKIRNTESISGIPIIMLTAKSEEIDKVVGLEMGADDYITKPFGVRELIARVRALLRRIIREKEESGLIKIGELTIDTESYKVYKNNKEIKLTSKEYELLKLLAINRGKTLTRDHLLDKIWGYDYYGETRTIDVHIRHLRKKIEDEDREPKYIHTVRGIGYSLYYKGDDEYA
ncbi:MAG: two-component system, OmpR family, alkaline phosphatase synthesis response regulator PhoP [Thermosediminibacterales bacterium]|nr:two-component system, OmpR family, alkaline phosphatase synthesis response regulator PhoP [Thermosediminibacterales bacterium]MDK2835287.1 two-component system, OmpR family, alkaline phosphatase synthesis response regulator PhoP [Thermosediminibacterales bacterium]